jgi:protein-disulfide isomerase
LAAESAEAAAAQGKFWEMHDLLFAHQAHLKEPDLRRYAGELGLDLARYAAEMDDHIYLQRVREHAEGGRRSHIRATPAFFVNGVVQDISYGMQSLHDAVAASLHRAGY